MASNLKPIWVKVSDRDFVVTLNEVGDIHTIKERKIYAPGEPWQAFYNAPYFHSAHHKLGGPATISGRIAAAVAEIQEKNS